MIDTKSIWELVAEKVERQPECLEVAMRNIARWRSEGHSAAQRLAEWERLLVAAQSSPDGFRQLLHILRAKDETAKRLREFSPFAGILTREERRHATELCGYRH